MILLSEGRSSRLGILRCQMGILKYERVGHYKRAEKDRDRKKVDTLSEKAFKSEEI